MVQLYYLGKLVGRAGTQLHVMNQTLGAVFSEAGGTFSYPWSLFPKLTVFVVYQISNHICVTGLLWDIGQVILSACVSISSLAIFLLSI